jgi:hypothetical protein
MASVHGISKQVVNILEEKGPMAYNGIHTELRKRQFKATKTQVLKCMDNLKGRKLAVSSPSDKRKIALIKQVDCLKDVVSDTQRNQTEPVEQAEEQTSERWLYFAAGALLATILTSTAVVI